MRTIDLQSILAGQIYGPLKDKKLFESVELDPEVHTLVWPNGADFDPATFHDWLKYEHEMKKMVKRWVTLEAKTAI